MIILYQFPEVFGIPNASPFCLKLETYFRMTALPYEVVFIHDPRKAPKGKLPFIRVDNKVMGDSECIIDYLKTKFGDPIDSQLSDLQKSEVVLLESCFSSVLYWLILYFRWQDEEGWRQVNQAYFNHLPFYLRLFLPKLLRSQMKKTLYLQGTGRHSKEEIVALCQKTLEALSIYLGRNQYFMGAEATSIDATAFGFLANIAWLPYEDPLQLLLKKHQNLREFCNRMWSIYYSERKQPFKITEEVAI